MDHSSDVQRIARQSVTDTLDANNCDNIQIMANMHPDHASSALVFYASLFQLVTGASATTLQAQSGVAQKHDNHVIAS